MAAAMFRNRSVWSTPFRLTGRTRTVFEGQRSPPIVLFFVYPPATVEGLADDVVASEPHAAARRPIPSPGKRQRGLVDIQITRGNDEKG